MHLPIPSLLEMLVGEIRHMQVLSCKTRSPRISAYQPLAFIQYFVWQVGCFLLGIKEGGGSVLKASPGQGFVMTEGHKVGP